MSRRQTGTWAEADAPAGAVPAPADRDFARICDILREHAGFSIDASKADLVGARVRRRLQALGLADFGAYLQALDADAGGQETVHLVDAVATNVTRFFRVPEHFAFAAAAARQQADRGRRLHFWSAGCATGEEPYSLAMSLREALPSTTDWRILATDISALALQKAQQGNYTPEQAAAAPRRFTESAFQSRSGPGGDVLRIDDDLKRMILFRRLNLGRTPFPVRGAFDVIFCRNEMIYFDPQQRADAVLEFHRLLLPGGHLIVGEAEMLLGVADRFERRQQAVYRRI